MLDRIDAVVDADDRSSRSDQPDGLETLPAPEVEEPAIANLRHHRAVARVVQSEQRIGSDPLDGALPGQPGQLTS